MSNNPSNNAACPNTSGRIKQSFVHGATILMGAMIVGKILGFAYRLPITWLLGTLGNGYFSTAYMIFTPFFSLSASGLTAAVARMVAEQSERKRWNDVRRIKRISHRVFLVAALFAFLFIVSLAWFFVNYVSPNPRALWSVLAIAPAAFFGIASASYRGYYEGSCNMNPTAISQIVENIIKIIVGLSLMYLIYYIGYAQVTAGNSFLGITTAVRHEYEAAIAPFAVAGALLGVSVSSLGSLVYLWFRNKI
ncbi:MAG: oligosaccharide flippase family protein, partial [Oscillospiraceae bacterium]|nr:oligosaccharide flippase family protein [Oscillospiraceae bacterium]